MTRIDQAVSELLYLSSDMSPIREDEIDSAAAGLLRGFSARELLIVRDKFAEAMAGWAGPSMAEH